VEDIIKENTDQTYAFVDEFLEEAIESSNIYETDEDVDYDYWSSNHNAHATLSISKPYKKTKTLFPLFYLKITSSLFLDVGSDTCVLGQG
jgi:hypothetical protein